MAIRQFGKSNAALLKTKGKRPLALALARSGNPRHDVGPCCSTAYYICIYIYKITSRQNNIELGTRRNEVSLIILITDKREKPIPCQSSRHTSAVWENLFRECRTQMCHTSCLATLPLDFYVAAAYQNQQSMSINAMNEKNEWSIWGAVKIYYNCLVCFWRVIVFWGGHIVLQGFAVFGTILHVHKS